MACTYFFLRWKRMNTLVDSKIMARFALVFLHLYLNLNSLILNLVFTSVPDSGFDLAALMRLSLRHGLIRRAEIFTFGNHGHSK